MKIEVAHPHQVGDVVPIEPAERARETFFAPATDMLAIQSLGTRERCAKAFGESTVFKLLLFLAVIDVVGELQLAREQRQVFLQHFELEWIELAVNGIERGADGFALFEAGLPLQSRLEIVVVDLLAAET